MHRIVYGEWGWREYRDLLYCCLSGRKDDGPEIAKVQAMFAEIYAGSSLFAVNRGRTALSLALQTFAKLNTDKKQVVYPAYICNSVIEAIEGAGLVPVPADVGEDLNLGLETAARKVTGDTLAILAAHAYGCPAPIGDLHALCRRSGVFLIDDAANVAGLGAPGSLLGCGGDVGVVSFTGSKSIVAGGYNAGGLLLVNNPALLEAIRREWEALPPPCYRAFELLHFLRDLQLEPYTWRAMAYYQAVRRRTIGEAGRHFCPPARLPNVSAVLAMRQLRSLPDRIAGRIRVAEAFHRHLAGLKGVRFPQYARGQYLTRIMVELPGGIDREAVRASLRRRGIATRRGYELDVTYGSDFPDIARRAPRLLELPSRSRLPEDAVAAICTALGEAIAAAGAAEPSAAAPRLDALAAQRGTGRPMLR